MAFVSPPELIRALLIGDWDVFLLVGDRVTVGSVDVAQVSLGAISLSMLPGVPEAMPTLVRPQLEASCVAPTVSEAEEIAQAVFLALHGKGRQVVAQANGHSYLVHFTRATTPALRQAEDGESWDVVVVIQTMVDTREVS